MTGVVTNLKRIFRKSSEIHLPVSPFRQFHLLHRFDSQGLTDLLQFSEQRVFADLSSDLSGKKGLFFSLPSTRILLERVLKKNPSHLVNYELEPFIPPANPLLISLCGGFKPLSLRPYAFDVLFAPLASFHKRELVSLIPQLASLLMSGGRAVFSFIHPALELFLYNQNPSSPVRAPNNLQGYFTAFKENNLFLEHLEEGVIDKECKPFFHQVGDTNLFEDYRGIPLVLFVRVVKYIKQ